MSSADVSKAMEAVVGILNNTASAPHKHDRELIKAIRRLFFLSHSISSSSSAASGGVSQASLDALLMAVVDLKSCPSRRILCGLLYQKLSETEPLKVLSSSSSLSSTSAIQERLLSLLLSFSPSTTFETHRDLFSSPSYWLQIIQDPIMRHRALPSLLAAFQTLHTATHPQLHDELRRLLIGCTLASSSDSKRTVVLEPDGTPSSRDEFFTVLNTVTTTAGYTKDQLLNHHVFSILRPFLLLGGGSLNESALSYCMRVIDQIKLRQTPFSSAATSEAIRILTVLSSFDSSASSSSSVNSKIVSIVKRSASLPMTQLDGHSYLAHLQFFLDSSSASADTWVASYLSSLFAGGLVADQCVAYETIQFVLFNAEKLQSVIASFWPCLLRIIAWHGPCMLDDFCDLLSVIVASIQQANGGLLCELLHSLLDLPLLTIALENSMTIEINNRLSATTTAPLPQQQPDTATNTTATTMTTEESFKPLINLLLRAQSGIATAQQHWFDDNIKRLSQQLYLHHSSSSQRVIALTSIVTPLLTHFFNLLNTTDTTEPLMVSVFHRFDPRQLYPSAEFVQTVQCALSQYVQRAFHSSPQLIITLKPYITDLFSEPPEVKETVGELLLTLIWIIGESLTSTVNQPQQQPTTVIPRDVLNDYYDLLEVIVFEQISSIKSASSTSSCDVFGMRLTMIVAGAVAKIAAKWQFFNSRVSLCLGKLAAVLSSQSSLVVVHQRVNECLEVLKFPSIASSVLSSISTVDSSTSLTDESSSLPFLLQPPLPVNPINTPDSLHSYSLSHLESSFH